jgi:hypothetical protein
VTANLFLREGAGLKRHVLACFFEISLPAGPRPPATLLPLLPSSVAGSKCQQISETEQRERGRGEEGETVPSSFPFSARAF